MKITSALFLALAALIASGCAKSTTDTMPMTISGEWVLVAYGASSNPTPALPDVETSFLLGEDGEFSGTAGCNSLGSEYQLDEDRITFGSISSTRMACPGVMDQEYGVLDILSENRLSITFDGNQMALTSEDGASVVIFSRK